jgi:hypothetical protein
VINNISVKLLYGYKFDYYITCCGILLLKHYYSHKGSPLLYVPINVTVSLLGDLESDNGDSKQKLYELTRQR